MDETRELTVQNLSKALRADAPSQRQQLQEFSVLLGRERSDLRLLAGMALEWLADLLAFERGFFLLENRGRTSGDAPACDFSVLASRRRLRGVSDQEWGPVPNPEFTVDHSVVTAAFASPDPLLINDCMVQPLGKEEAKHRAVLCHSFRLGPDSRGAIYLDRGLGMPQLEETERNVFRDVLALCVPIFGRAFLAEEVARLQEVVAAGTGEAEPRGDGTSLTEEVEHEEEAPDETDDFQARSASPVEDFYGIVGRDEKLQKIFDVVRKVKDTNFNICVFGESGTGKELVARAIHRASNRSQHRFISENCGAITENLLESELFGHVKGAFTGADEDRQGLFELADQGTLFLDEIGDMSEGMQRKLLRALQEGTIRPIGSKKSLRVDVRVICASNRDLKHLVREGKFRADLYYRLNVIQINLPPLRERRGDIPLLVDKFVTQLADEEGIRKRLSESAAGALLSYGWPGNIRELKNVIRRVMLTCPRRVVARKDVLSYLSGAQAAVCLGENLERDEDHLVLRIPLRQTFNEIIDECERLVLINALKENGWNKSRVTKALGIPRQSLYNKIAKYDLQRSWKEDS